MEDTNLDVAVNVLSTIDINLSTFFLYREIFLNFLLVFPVSYYQSVKHFLRQTRIQFLGHLYLAAFQRRYIKTTSAFIEWMSCILNTSFKYARHFHSHWISYNLFEKVCKPNLILISLGIWHYYLRDLTWHKNIFL